MVDPDKTLLDQHPLFRRLTGQVIWTYLEELGAQAEAIDAFMDRMLALREAVLTLHQTLEEEGGALRLVLADTPTDAGGFCAPCAHCAALVGQAIPADSPEVIALMPPYTLGCRLWAEHLDAPAVLRQSETRLLTDPAELPAHGPFCPTAQLTRTTPAGSTGLTGADDWVWPSARILQR